MTTIKKNELDGCAVFSQYRTILYGLQYLILYNIMRAIYWTPDVFHH